MSHAHEDPCQCKDMQCREHPANEKCNRAAVATVRHRNDTDAIGDRMCASCVHQAAYALEGMRIEWDDEPAVRNTNCLEGLRCPKCNSLEPFSIVATAAFLVFDDGTEDYSDVVWTEGDHIRCVECNHSATIADFQEVE